MWDEKRCCGWERNDVSGKRIDKLINLTRAEIIHSSSRTITDKAWNLSWKWMEAMFTRRSRRTWQPMICPFAAFSDASLIHLWIFFQRSKFYRVQSLKVRFYIYENVETLIVNSRLFQRKSFISEENFFGWRWIQRAFICCNRVRTKAKTAYLHKDRHMQTHWPTFLRKLNHFFLWSKE